MDYVTCPVCGDDVEAPTDPAGQAAWLRERAAALLAAADRIERGESPPIGPYGSPA